MLQSKRIATAALLLTGFLSLNGASFAQKNTDSPAEQADEAAIHEYILTMPRIEAFAAASKDAEAAQKDPVFAEEAKKLEDNDKSSMLEKARIIETQCPHFNAWIKAHGFTAREFMLLPMTLGTAGLAAIAKEKGGKIVDFVNPANVAFYEQHKADLEKLNLNGSNSDQAASSDQQ